MTTRIPVIEDQKDNRRILRDLLRSLALAKRFVEMHGFQLSGHRT